MAKKRSKPKTTKPAVNGTRASEHANRETSISAPVTLPTNICRLCETHDGPFLNLFDSEKNTAKTIESIMPFELAENDDLPKMICFRCSAKVEELNEFVQKCIKTLENFSTALGKKTPLNNKAKTHRLLWEEKLNKSNTTNEVICDAVVKKAMEGITRVYSLKDQPVSNKQRNDKDKKRCSVSLVPLEMKSPATAVTKSPPVAAVKKSSPTIAEADTSATAKTPTGGKCTDSAKAAPLVTAQASANAVKPVLKRKKKMNDDIPATQRTSVEPTQKEDEKEVKRPIRSTHVQRVTRSRNEPEPDLPEKPIKNRQNESKETLNGGNTSKEVTTTLEETKDTTPPVKQDDKPFDIMDHVCMIKVNEVGILFQCQLCNRNFLKKEVVLTHWCAKNGAAKEDFTKKIPLQPIEAPRVPTVKYINTKTVAEINNQAQKHMQNIENKSDTEFMFLDKKKGAEVKPACIPEKKPKPRIGPASKVKRMQEQTEVLSNQNIVKPNETTSPPKNTANISAVHYQSTPSSSCPYKVLVGPNNTFNLREAQSTNKRGEETSKKIPSRPSILKQKRKIDHDEAKAAERISQQRKSVGSINSQAVKVTAGSSGTPYPVGLIKSVPRQSSTPGIVPFCTTAQKKQSYEVVPTDNPSKILIMAKTGQSRQKEVKTNNQPYSVTMEDTTHPGDPGFFTFINVDPLLEPSYVLPTDNILQEAPMPAHKMRHAQKPFSCNMCHCKFSSERGLLIHMARCNEDEELRVTKTARRRKN